MTIARHPTRLGKMIHLVPPNDPVNALIAQVGPSAHPLSLKQFAPQVTCVVLALDADESGAIATERLVGAFRQAVFIVTLCPPPQDPWGKDWSERFRRPGPQSI